MTFLGGLMAGLLLIVVVFALIALITGGMVYAYVEFMDWYRDRRNS